MPKIAVVDNVISYMQVIREIASDEINIASDEKERLSFYQDNNNLENDTRQYFSQINKEMQPRLNKFLNRQRLKDYNQKGIHYEFKFFYRGHYDASFNLLPSVFRKDNWYKEDFYYHEIMVSCPGYFQHSSHIDKLVTMQHYDCPTRLLDVTSNPLVALYFACKNYRCSKCDSSDMGDVHVFPVFPSDVAYSDSDKVLMLSCLARFTTDDRTHLYKEAVRNLASDKFSKSTNGRYKDEVVERFFYEVTTERPSFKREIRPIDLLRPLFVQPNKTNSRILKQDGAFILNGLSNSSGEALRKIEAISHGVIRIKDQESILWELEQFGIHEAALFPEMDKVANYLKGK